MPVFEQLFNLNSQRHYFTSEASRAQFCSLLLQSVSVFNELVEGKQEKTVFQCVTLHSMHHIINENPMKPSY